MSDKKEIISKSEMKRVATINPQYAAEVLDLLRAKNTALLERAEIAELKLAEAINDSRDAKWCLDQINARVMPGSVDSTDAMRAIINEAEFLKMETANAKIVAEVAREELVKVKAANICDSCAGAGQPISGKPCMCRGTGLMSVAALYLREEMVRAQIKLEIIEKKFQPS